MPKYILRHGVMRNLGVFSTRGSDQFVRGQQVIARTHRGLESGEVLCEATDEAVAQIVDPKQGQILRLMSDDDMRDLRKMFEQERREYEICQEQDQAACSRHETGRRRAPVRRRAGGGLLPGRRTASIFASWSKCWPASFKPASRCGRSASATRPSCWPTTAIAASRSAATRILSEMPPVSMKMAKLQKATLDPTKISGRCGRLKCCLRYEYDTYQSLQRELPPVGADVVTTTAAPACSPRKFWPGRCWSRPKTCAAW